MMKLKGQKLSIQRFVKPFHSIRFRIWGAMVLSLVITLLLIYILGVVLLEKQYLNKKHDEVARVIENVRSQIKDEDFSKLSSYLYELALKNNMCIEISNSNGVPIIRNEGLSNSCFLHQNQTNRMRILSQIYDNEGTQTFTVKDSKDDSSSVGYLVAGTHEVDKSYNYLLIITASLAPVKETTAIISSQLLFISLIVLVVVTIVSFVLSMFITRPIKQLNTSFGRVTNGDLNVKAAVSGQDEISQLGKSFNYMVEQIKTTTTMQRELIANVSHDLKTPLTMIKGYAELMRDITGEDKVTRNHQLEIIVDETDRLSELVGDIMDLSLLQAGVKKLECEGFCIITMLRNVSSRFEVYRQSNGYNIQLNIPKSSPLIVWADRPRIEQVLYNLINNAIAHIGEDKTVVINLLKDTDQLVRVEIIDHGVGIDPNVITLIWDRYYKPYRSSVSRGKGTGLGLSIVKTILTAHNVSFGVSSTLGQGSNFWFTLSCTNEINSADSDTETLI